MPNNDFSTRTQICGQLSTLLHLILTFICLHIIEIKTRFSMEHLMHDEKGDVVGVTKAYIDYSTCRSRNFHLVFFSNEDWWVYMHWRQTYVRAYEINIFVILGGIWSDVSGVFLMKNSRKFLTVVLSLTNFSFIICR